MRRPNLLIADDEPGVRRWLREIFDETAQRIDEVDGGEALLAALLRGPAVDLVISDVRMPQLDGIEAAGLARDAGVTTPFLFFTAAPRDARIERALQRLGRAALVGKSTDGRSLLAIAHRLLAEAEAAHETKGSR